MVKIKDHKTPDMFDPTPFLGPKRKQLLATSWASLFRDVILPTLPVEKIYCHYNASQGAPSKELYSVLGVMIIQQMLDLTDEETVAQVAFNIQWHYALNITSTTDADTYISPKTLWTMRDNLTYRNLYNDIFERAVARLADVFSADVSRQRIDSIHIFSNMRHLGRIGLFVKTIKTFLVNLKRQHKDLYESLEASIVDRYMTKQGATVFSMVKPTESVKTLSTLADDVFALVERFKGSAPVTAMNSYHLLARLLKEQCIVEANPDSGAPRVSVKANKDVPSDSLQNPSDPDASYDGHKGKGYQVQVAESYSIAGETNTLSLITAVAVEPAHKSDAHALIPLIESTQERGLGPKEVTADSLYGSDENCQKAKNLGVDVVSPVMGKTPEGAVTLVDFTTTDEGAVTVCLAGHAPEKLSQSNGKHNAVFNAQLCDACPFLNGCPVSAGENGHVLRYTDKMLRLAQRRAREDTADFRNTYRYRSGVEGTMSQYDRVTGVKHLRVRGLPAVSFAAVMKAVGINIFRATAFRNEEKEGELAPSTAASRLYSSFKDRLHQAIAATTRWSNYMQYYVPNAMPGTA
jgi:hypothetical protein